MKKFTKLSLKIVPILLVVVVLFAPIASAATNGIDPKMPGATGNITAINTAAGNIWGTIQTVVQILAIAAVIIAGVRYMFASANDKADIKKQTMFLVFGALLVFAAVPVIKFIISIANQVGIK